MNGRALAPMRRLSNTPVRDTLTYDMSLDISRCDRRSCGTDGFHVNPLGWPFPPGELWDAHIPLAEKEVYNAVEDTLRVWHDKVIHLDVDVDGTTVKPYQRGWDLAGRPNLLDIIGPQVAQAGQAMFYRSSRRAETTSRSWPTG